MEMSIDEAIEIISDIDKAYRTFSNMEYKAMQKSIDVMRKYQQLQANYEARLKADMVAMLTEIQLEIKELWDNRYDVWLDNQYYIGKSDTLEEVDEVIQQKIDKLRGEESG